MHASQYTWKGREPSATASQSGKTKVGAASSARNLVHNDPHGGRELKLDSLPEKEGHRADPLGQATQEFAIVPHTAQQGLHLL